MNIFKRLKDWSDSRGISKQEPNRNGYTANIVEELGEYLEAAKKGDEGESVDAICDIMVFSATELVKMGYDIEKSMNQVLLEVESRTGEWDDKNKKFQKYLTDEAKALWVKADYTKAKENDV